MIAARKAVRTDKASRTLSGLAVDLLRTFKSLADPYRPEQHYMRGPGPKWRAKHNPAPVTQDATAVPTLVSVNG